MLLHMTDGEFLRRYANSICPNVFVCLSIRQSQASFL